MGCGEAHSSIGSHIAPQPKIRPMGRRGGFQRARYKVVLACPGKRAVLVAETRVNVLPNWCRVFCQPSATLEMVLGVQIPKGGRMISVDGGDVCCLCGWSHGMLVSWYAGVMV